MMTPSIPVTDSSPTDEVHTPTQYTGPTKGKYFTHSHTHSHTDRQTDRQTTSDNGY